jgi:2-polyprenyl-3-methyl-5-hydroxy-6-metoxy-1,4-benzoquinol methylase
LSVGRIVRRKGLPAFIAQSLPALLERFPDLVFAIIGEEPAAAVRSPGAEMQAIREAIARCAFETTVRLCGRVTDELLHAAYAEADALVFPVLELPGDVEGFGMVAVEAAAHGLPTFGFRSGGVSDAVHEGITGELVPTGDYVTLTRRLTRYLEVRHQRRYHADCVTHAFAHGWTSYGERLGSVLGAMATPRKPAVRGYQFGYSTLHPEVNDATSRARKAATAIAVIEKHLGHSLQGLRVADVGGSSGVMAATFAREGAIVTAIDIDEAAIEAARNCHHADELDFRVGDAMALDFADSSLDIVLCCHVYEHVPDAQRMMSEIHRVLRPRGICYFSAGNRFTWREPHHGLPLLSVIPVALAHHYLRLMNRGDFYHERHLGYGGLRRLVREFELHDYTPAIVDDPSRYGAHYMIQPGSMLQHLAKALLRLAPHIFPNFIWLLERVDIDKETGSCGSKR